MPDTATREQLVRAHCVEQFDVLVTGASRGDEQAVILAFLLPPGPGSNTGWTFPLPPDEARRIGTLLIEKANEKGAGRG